MSTMQRMPTMQPPHIGRIALTVSDLSRSLNYYQNNIGLQLLEREDGKAVLGVGERPLLILHEQPGARPVRGRTGLYHFAILLPSRRDLGLTLHHLLTSQTPIGGYADHAVSEAIYLTDPDGHGIEIYRDRPRSQWEYPGDTLKMTIDPFDFEGVLGEVEDPPPPWMGMPDGTMMGHIHLHVAHIPPTEQYYVNGIGFDLMVRYGAAATFLAANGYHHHLGANTWAGVGAPPPSEDGARLLWYEIILPSVDDFEVIGRRLQEQGYRMERQGDQIITQDPSANQIHLTL
jgi:catechol 2,3-dioxygenase